jgi:hypothetical protein
VNASGVAGFTFASLASFALTHRYGLASGAPPTFAPTVAALNAPSAGIGGVEFASWVVPYEAMSGLS